MYIFTLLYSPGENVLMLFNKCVQYRYMNLIKSVWNCAYNFHLIDHVNLNDRCRTTYLRHPNFVTWWQAVFTSLTDMILICFPWQRPPINTSWASDRSISTNQALIKHTAKGFEVVGWFLLPEFFILTHGGRETHICVGKLGHHCLRKWLVA